MDQLRRSFSFLLLILAPLSIVGHPLPIQVPSHELIISSFFVRSTIVSRYAATRVWISMSNPHPEAKEAIFDLDLPRSAFISNFTITMNEKIYVAEVKEKHKAKKMYEEAHRQGRTAAHIGTKDREMEKFRVSTSVEAGRKVAFELTYEELLQRHLGKYQHAISIRPQQLVRNLTVEVSISERTGIDHVQVLPLRTSRLMTNTLQGEADMPPSTRVEKGRHCAWIVFTPTLQEQESFSTSGIVGDFVVQYDVAMPDVSGDVQIYNGYFAHYFAPRGMPLLQKDVVFVIDISGSMYGTKLKQIKKAMHVILSDLHQDDHFNIVTFSDTVNVWKPNQSIQATSQNIRKAKDYASKMEADGWTDINAALLAAASLFNQSSSMDGKVEKEPRIPLIIFLTDGEATSGVTAGSRILTNAQRALKGTISLFGLAFGDDADYGLLRRLSLENRGVARRIYEDADATLQLKGFYDEIASPLLYDVELSYLDGVAEGLTQNLFPNYFQGSELVVVGRVKPGATKLQVRTTGQGQEGPLNLDNDISTNTTQAVPFGCLAEINKIGHFVQRLWAYFTIQDLLQARFRANDTAARRLLTEKATNLSIKYNFVTPVTSLVVVRPEEARDGNQPVKTTIPPGVTRALKASPRALAVSVLPRLSKAAKPVPGVTDAPAITKAFKEMMGTGAVPVTAPRLLKAARATSSPVTTMSTFTTPSVYPTITPTATGHPKSAKVTTILGRTAISWTPVVSHRSTKPPRATATLKSTRSPVTLPKFTPTRAARLKPTVQPHPTLETRGIAVTKVMARVPHTVARALTLYPSTSPKILESNSSRWEQPKRTPWPVTEYHSYTKWQVSTARMETGKLPRSRTDTKDRVTSKLHIDRPQEKSTVSWATSLTTQAAELEGVSLVPDTSTSASDISLLLLPGESELPSTTIQNTEYVESLNPPAVYSILIPNRLGENLDYGDYPDFFEESDSESDSLGASPKSGLFTFSSWVDGDPHFVIKLPRSQGNLCFTLDGRLGDILRLVSDPATGLSVNGHLMGAPSRPGHEERPRTYLDVITIVVERPRASYVVNITQKGVTLYGEEVLVLPLIQQATISKPPLAISMWPEANITVQIGSTIEFLVLLHHYSHPTVLQLDHLGFYIMKGQGLSASAGGLLGQFQNSNISLSPDPSHGGKVAWMQSGANKVLLTEVSKVLKDSVQRAHEAKCWLVKRKDVEELLGASYSSYLASNLLEI
ncbi:inter-alpha-trypsin inhibitor heavy chain H6 [Pseudonaja textilis]|uniref:inter-alpha-trypsin inhibitor heavy chain H6 n=1 Tax=Pseudonaja textilis TaxID=8673 RepID=UPI000EA8B5CA|nr:inter-alpha-trypsin inhibitor heavy chain H6 [Pseudonaja textilis]